jgi:hypothetical protein
MRTYLLIAAASLTVPVLGFLAQLPLPEVGNLTATAMLGWYAWHTVARTIPDIVANFRAELAAERVEHRATVEAICRELATDRRQRHADAAALLEALRSIQRP